MINRRKENHSVTMNSIEISEILSRNKYTRKIFKGVYPIDVLPNGKIKPPFLIIINTAKSSHPGKHWIAIFVPTGSCTVELFDSYGRYIENKYLTNFFVTHSKTHTVLYNNKKLQSHVSEICGQYCCVYGYYRARGISMEDFLDTFSNSVHENDRKLMMLLQEKFK